MSADTNRMLCSWDPLTASQAHGQTEHAGRRRLFSLTYPAPQFPPISPPLFPPIWQSRFPWHGALLWAGGTVHRHPQSTPKGRTNRHEHCTTSAPSPLAHTQDRPQLRTAHAHHPTMAPGAAAVLQRPHTPVPRWGRPGGGGRWAGGGGHHSWIALRDAPGPGQNTPLRGPMRPRRRGAPVHGNAAVGQCHALTHIPPALRGQTSLPSKRRLSMVFRSNWPFFGLFLEQRVLPHRPQL